jgi:hypothetical protein
MDMLIEQPLAFVLDDSESLEGQEGVQVIERGGPIDDVGFRLIDDGLEHCEPIARLRRRGRAAQDGVEHLLRRTRHDRDPVSPRQQPGSNRRDPGGVPKTWCSYTTNNHGISD